MNLHDYLRVLRERWRIALIAVVVAVVAAGVTWSLRPQEYTANLTMYVSAQTTDNPQSAFQGAQLSQERVTSYVELVRRPRVSQEVIDDLGLTDTTAEHLAKRITASSTLDSVLIDVEVVDESPRRAADVANSVGRVFSRLVDDLERPRTPGAIPAVAVSVVQPAAIPQGPSSSSLPLTLAVGLMCGLVLGIGGALGRNALDTSIKSPDQLREVAGAPSLGIVAFEATVPKRPLTVQGDPQSPRAEAFRQLRTNLQFVDVDRPPKVIVVTSSMPEEGKTTTLANVAIALSSAGQRVIVLEADLRRPKLAALYGLESAIGLTSVLSGRVQLGQAIQQWSGGIDVLASGPLPPNPSELLASENMVRLLDDLRSQYDVVLLDTPPLLPVTDAAAVSSSADGAILICRFKDTNRDQVRMAVEALTSVSARLLGTVLTMVPKTGPRAFAHHNTYYRAEQSIVQVSTLSAAPPPRGATPRNGRKLVDPPAAHRPQPSPRRS